MTYAPPTLTALARYYVDQGGVNSGIVGNAAHAARASYHNGLDRAIASYGANRTIISERDYTFRLPRDRNGASNAASAFDLGKLSGSLVKLRKFSIWLKEQCEAKAPGTRDIRDIIYTPDGVNVKRWDNADGVLKQGYPTASGQGDSTHLWHTHISYFRDSEDRDKVALFRAYFQPQPQPQPGEEMIYDFDPKRMGTVAAGTDLLAVPGGPKVGDTGDVSRRYIPGYDKSGKYATVPSTYSGSPLLYYALKTAVTEIGPEPLPKCPDPVPCPPCPEPAPAVLAPTKAALYSAAATMTDGAAEMTSLADALGVRATELKSLADGKN